MSQVKTRSRILAIIAKRETTEGLNPETNYALACGESYCPFLKSIDNAFVLGEEELYPELVKLIDLIPDARDYYRDNESVWHQIARTGLEGMGFSLSPHPEEDTKELYDQIIPTEPVEDRRVLFGTSLEGRDPLGDSGIHTVTDPGFGYTD